MKTTDELVAEILKAMKKEESIQLALCKYVRLKYPEAIFTSESSGIRLTMGQAKKLKSMRSSNGLPDFMLFEPRGTYHGLFLELKAINPYKKDGMTLKSDPHLKEQLDTLLELSNKGYLAEFAVGLDDAIRQVDYYMDL